MGRLSEARRLVAKAKELVAKNDAKVKETLDKVAGVVDDKTKGRYTDKIEGAVAKTKEAVDKLPDRASAAEGSEPAPAPGPEPGPEPDADQRQP